MHEDTFSHDNAVSDTQFSLLQAASEASVGRGRGVLVPAMPTVAACGYDGYATLDGAGMLC